VSARVFNICSATLVNVRVMTHESVYHCVHHKVRVVTHESVYHDHYHHFMFSDNVMHVQVATYFRLPFKLLLLLFINIIYVGDCASGETGVCVTVCDGVCVG